jgi:hypothetical protein
VLCGEAFLVSSLSLPQPSLFAVIGRGVRVNLAPALALQCFALVLVVAYYMSPSVGAWLNGVGELKAAHGFAFSVPSTALFGGLVPFFVLWARGAVPRERAAFELLFYLAFWCWKGAEVDAFYRAEAWYFGATTEPLVIAKKVFVDQFLYNPLWAAPTQTLCFLWKDVGFSSSALRAQLSWPRFLRQCAVVLVSTWVVWVPAVSIIYALPSSLQLPLFNLVLCFWCLLLTFVSRARHVEPVHGPG